MSKRCDSQRGVWAEIRTLHIYRGDRYHPCELLPAYVPDPPRPCMLRIYPFSSYVNPFSLETADFLLNLNHQLQAQIPPSLLP